MSTWEGKLIEAQRDGRKVKVVMRKRITLRIPLFAGQWENVREMTWEVSSLGLDQGSWGKSKIV